MRVKHPNDPWPHCLYDPELLIWIELKLSLWVLRQVADQYESPVVQNIAATLLIRRTEATDHATAPIGHVLHYAAFLRCGRGAATRREN